MPNKTAKPKLMSESQLQREILKAFKDDPTEEVWKPIAGYEGSYEVSNHGRVKSLDRLIYRNESKPSMHKGRILKDKYNYRGQGKGAKIVDLYAQGVKTGHLVHRLVATAFIPNPDNLPCVNHKDENPSSNHVDNLEWCTHKYNTNYGTNIERLRKQKEHKCKPVILIDDYDRIIERFASLHEASRQLKIYRSDISDVCNGKYKQIKGFRFKFDK